MQIAGEAAKAARPTYPDTCSIPQGAVFVGSLRNPQTGALLESGAFLKGEDSKYTRLANTQVRHDPSRKDRNGHRVDHLGNHYSKSRAFTGKVYLRAEVNLGEAE